MMWTRAAVLACALLAACGGTVAVGGGGSSATGTHTISSGGAGGAGGVGAVACNPSGASCKSLPPSCPPGQVPSVVGGCWGPCVDILSCATEPDCAGCGSGFCVGYAAWTMEYRCVLPALECQAFACSCLAPYFCVAPYDGCATNPGAEPGVTCACTSC